MPQLSADDTAILPPDLPPALCLIGPTAAGKTDLAMEIARRFPVEIINLDSAQVFIDMNIGTAKPGADTLAAFPHHLLDRVSPEESYSAARFRHEALETMHAIVARGRMPLLVGGTMLYYKVLQAGLADLPAADSTLRARISDEARLRGWPALHAELARHDPATAARLAPQDAQRIQRALEVWMLTGQPLDVFLTSQPRQTLPFALLTIALVTDQRPVLHARIARRFHAMLEAGFISEVEVLRKKYRLNADLPAMRSVGYRQIWEMLEGLIPEADLAERGIIATRQLAKRQLTWLRAFHAAGDLDIRIELAAANVTGALFETIERHRKRL